MAASVKAWLNRLLQTGKFVAVGVTATNDMRFIAWLKFKRVDGVTMRMFSTVKSESPEKALEDLWNRVDRWK